MFVTVYLFSRVRLPVYARSRSATRQSHWTT